MKNLKYVTGAKLKVFIQYDSDLEQTGLILQKYLNISDFRYEQREEEPYDLIGYSEIFGFEIELRHVQSIDQWQEYPFVLEAFTTDSFQELFDGNMCDLSLWMARYLSLCNNVTTIAENPDTTSIQKFYYNNDSLQRESMSIQINK